MCFESQASGRFDSRRKKRFSGQPPGPGMRVLLREDVAVYHTGPEGPEVEGQLADREFKATNTTDL